VRASASRAALLREQAERLTRPGVLSVGGEPPAWVAATTDDAEQVRASTVARLERLRAGLAAGNTPEQLGLRLLDPERLAELRRGTG
jgi:hypothetical protein